MTKINSTSRPRRSSLRAPIAFLGRAFQEAGVQMSRISIHDILATDDHAVIPHETTITQNARALTGQYADVYHVRNGKLTEHWHLAVNPEADQNFFPTA
jgi:predicted SnoaL-like aldol condensation-catalyzing enzyme